MNFETQSSEMILKEKLSAALENIKEKESLVNQHAKVAEEAITGWEKAEREAFVLKQRSSSLEDRVIQLDGALKECLRQLREATRIDLKLELQEELEIRTIERDLSMQEAETARKQHLESVKKVTELESECQRLKDYSVGRNRLFDHSVEIISLMDDFVEMERLLGLPEANENERFFKTEMKIWNLKTRQSMEIDAKSIGKVEVKKEIEHSKMKYGIELVNTENLKGDVKTKKDKEMEIAASRLANCMETIASINRQLKSLAKFEEFLVDSENPIIEIPKEMLHVH
ncbi:filament-like plant protein 1 [Impatiens glandulifera]|uniref:filament-like plant protein 1 n=1 Tax=Impatiens glandulifera TaxID=253017 RepID=UPI001FB14DEA|nr:filament-like plant protein 1 [Impatiens glandulifera]